MQPVPRTWKCLYCGLVCYTPTEINEHISTVHSEVTVRQDVRRRPPQPTTQSTPTAAYVPRNSVSGPEAGGVIDLTQDSDSDSEQRQSRSPLADRVSRSSAQGGISQPADFKGAGAWFTQRLSVPDPFQQTSAHQQATQPTPLPRYRNPNNLLGSFWDRPYKQVRPPPKVPGDSQGGVAAGRETSITPSKKSTNTADSETIENDD